MTERTGKPTMSAERWRRVRELFSEAVQREPAARTEYLASACAGDPGLEAEVEELLRHYDATETTEFLAAPALPPVEIPAGLPDFGDYEDIHYLGHGGMGVVYRARKVSLDVHVALKMTLPSYLGGAVDSRPLSEAKRMARLDHPNIVPVYEVGEHGGKAYFSMKLVDGGSLEDRVAPTTTGPRDVARLMAKVALAVNHAHRRGILHCDLKPGNILLDTAGEPYVTDLGLARWTGEENRASDTEAVDSRLRFTASRIMGTVGYMSPEQASGGELTTLSDVYALGGILYALLTGRPPFRGETDLETLELAREGNVEPLRAVQPTVDPDLETICLKCLQKEPEERYASARALADDLQLWLERKRPRVISWSPAKRLWRWCQRNPVASSLLVGMYFLLAAVDVGGTAAALHERENLALVANSDLARSVAGRVRERLDRVSVEVREAARELRLRVAGLPTDRKLREEECQEILSVLKQLKEDSQNRYRLVGEEPFSSCFLVDGRSFLQARYPPPRKYEDCSWRDYDKGARKLSASPPAELRAYISKVYRGRTTDVGMTEPLYKFGISASVGGPVEPTWVVVASVTTGSPLGSLLPEGDDRVAVLAGTWDSGEGYRSGQALILSHPEFRLGDKTLPIYNGTLREVQEAETAFVTATDQRYIDPVGKSDPRFAGEWLAGFSRVPDTSFVVIVQQRREAVIAPYELPLRVSLWAGGVVLAALVIAGASVSHRLRSER